MEYGVWNCPLFNDVRWTQDKLRRAQTAKHTVVETTQDCIPEIWLSILERETPHSEVSCGCLQHLQENADMFPKLDDGIALLII